jgi:hypothetical protein
VGVQKNKLGHHQMAAVGMRKVCECYNCFCQTSLRAPVFFLTLAQTWKFVGEWLSLVEHLVRDQGVGGSNPLSPTIYSRT